MEKIWKTKEGVKIPIKEMTDSHLVNTILMLKRNSKEGVILSAPKFDTDNWVDEEYRGKDYLNLTPYYYMLREAKKRGLKVFPHNP